MIRLPALEEFFQRRVWSLGQNDLEMNILIAPLTGTLIDNSLAAQPKRRAGIGSLRHGHGDVAVDRRHRHFCAEHRFRRAHRKVQVNINVLAFEDVVFPDIPLTRDTMSTPAFETLLAAAKTAHDTHAQLKDFVA